MTMICTICARGGSKGVPGKNVKMIGGLPLIAHSIQQAKDSGLFIGVAVSSDDAEILRVAGQYGAEWLIERPTDLATDSAAKVPVIAHTLRAAEDLAGQICDAFVDLDATSPLRYVSDIQGTTELLQVSGARNVITGSPARRSPYFNMVERQPDGHVSLSKPLNNAVVRRQDVPACYDMNASIYVWRRDAFLQEPAVFYDDTQIFVMPEERSYDIDSPLDWAIVKMLMEAR